MVSLGVTIWIGFYGSVLSGYAYTGTLDECREFCSVRLKYSESNVCICTEVKHK